MNKPITEMGFEEAMAGLEDRVRKIESGELPLEETLALYEEGVQLAQRCHDQLDEADQRVAALSPGSSGPEETPLPDIEEP